MKGNCIVICLHALKKISKIGSHEFAFLISSHTMSVLLAWGSHFEDYRARDSIVRRENRS